MSPHYQGIFALTLMKKQPIFLGIFTFELTDPCFDIAFLKEEFYRMLGLLLGKPGNEFQYQKPVTNSVYWMNVF